MLIGIIRQYYPSGTARPDSEQGSADLAQRISLRGDCVVEWECTNGPSEYRYFFGGRPSAPPSWSRGAAEGR